MKLAKKTWDNIKDYSLTMPVIFDIFFLFFFGIVFEYFRQNVLLGLEEIITIMSTSQLAFDKGMYTINSLFSALKELPGFSRYYGLIWQNFALFVILVFILWCVFQSVSWWYAYKLNKKKYDLVDFMKKFTKKTVIFYLILVIGLLIAVRYNIYVNLVYTSFTEAMVDTMFFIFALVVFVLAVLKYANIDMKLKGILMKYKEIGFSIAVILIGFIIIHYLLFILLKIHYFVMIVGGVVVLMPFITYSRMLLINALE